jgi:hypothetical protein
MTSTDKLTGAIAVLIISVSTGLGATGTGAAGKGVSASRLPGEWLAAWKNPPAECRPLQIVHGLPPSQATPEAMEKLKALGLGGIVCNVSFERYLRHEPHWGTLIEAVKACEQRGLVVWIYDEKGYPSGSAGGLVLEGHGELESSALTYEPGMAEAFAVRPSYEHTHASNNFHAARRYPNLLDERATQRFIEVTHGAYARRLEPFLGTTIRAFFTDEPSLMAVNIGQLPEQVRKNVRVEDAVDPNVRALPSVPWVGQMGELYSGRFDRDLAGARRSLFTGDAESDRQVRRDFWSLVSDLLAERYYGRIQDWCRRHRVASSGHILWEEMPLHGVPLEGNPLQMLGRMDIPGLDMLTSNPEAAIHSGWLTATLPASAAVFSGGRKVMTEVSDFSETMAGKGPASVEQMRAAAGWQAALGVTEFTLYYNRGARSAGEYRAYCDFVGRLNAVLREAHPASNVLLYYPIYDLWAEYRPVAEKLVLDSQSERTKRIVSSFMSMGSAMTRRQISFALADHRLLGDADVRHDLLWVTGRPFDALVLPAGVELPANVAQVVRQFKDAGGTILDGSAQGQTNFDAIAAAKTLGKASERIVVGRFTRSGCEILLAVNVGAEPYAGTVRARNASGWVVADPATGRIEAAAANGPDHIRLSLDRRASLLLIGPAQVTE